MACVCGVIGCPDLCCQLLHRLGLAESIIAQSAMRWCKSAYMYMTRVPCYVIACPSSPVEQLCLAMSQCCLCMQPLTSMQPLPAGPALSSARRARFLVEVRLSAQAGCLSVAAGFGHHQGCLPHLSTYDQ